MRKEFPGCYNEETKDDFWGGEVIRFDQCEGWEEEGDLWLVKYADGDEEHVSYHELVAKDYLVRAAKRGR